MVWTKSLITLCALSLNLCLDYSLSSISLQAYWLTLGGDPDWTGFVFGAYDLLTIIIAPSISWIVSRYKYTSFRYMFIYAVLLNLSGNILYSVAGYFNEWLLLFSGRIIAGCGASFLPLIMVYVSMSIDKQHQQLVVGYIKYSAALARIIGPVIASILVLTPSDTQFNNNQNTLQVLFNVYTLPTWIAVCFNICVLISTLIFVTNPNVVDELSVKRINNSINNDDDNDKNGTNVFTLYWYIWVIGLLSTFLYWMMMANGFLISAAYYHLIHSTRDLWKIYISGLAGFLIAFAFFIKFKRKIKPYWFLVIALIILHLGAIFFNVKQYYFYYVAVGVSTLGYGITIPSINVNNNLVTKQNYSIIGGYRALVISILTIFQSIGRLLGASTFTWITNINVNDQCNVDEFIVDGCSIENYHQLLIISII